MMAEILFLPDVEPLPIAKGDRVKVNTYDWERGEIDIAGTVTKVEHETAWVLVDDALVFPVPLTDCSRMEAQ
jgi:ribosome maturation factor RimP